MPVFSHVGLWEDRQVLWGGRSISLSELRLLRGRPVRTTIGGVGKTDWNPLLKDQFEQPYWAELQTFVQAERRAHQVYPAHDDVFAALHLTSYADVRVVILGQDPYHGPDQAHGLSFSVRPGVAVPPSLRNMYKELEADLGITPPGHGNLEAWARNGVLLLNSVLTVRAHEAGSHRKKGWETFTDQIIQVVSAKPEPVVFILWGNYARAKAKLIADHHHLIESAHPSPLSASRGFFGSKPFSKTNDALHALGRDPVDWSLPPLD